jgi:hypothetical protein
MKWKWYCVPDEDVGESWQGLTSVNPIDLAETSACGVSSLAGSYCEVCIVENSSHTTRLIKPVVTVVLYDAEAIYPNAAYVELTANSNGVTKGLRKFCQWYTRGLEKF